jgi:hypothetical protein
MKTNLIFIFLLLIVVNQAFAKEEKQYWLISVVDSKNGVHKTETWQSVKPFTHSKTATPSLLYSMDNKTVSKTALDPTQDTIIYTRAFQLIARNTKKYHLKSSDCDEFMQVQVGVDQTKICLPDAQRASEYNEIMASLKDITPAVQDQKEHTN